MNSIYTAEQVRAFEENSFIEEGDDLQAMMEAAKQSVEILNRDFAKSEFIILCVENLIGYFLCSDFLHTDMTDLCTPTCVQLSRA